jgi:hypothetical protein
MNSFTIAIAALMLAFAVSTIPAKANCVRSWSPGEYKSFGQVQAEILGRYAGGRIISVQLCGQGPSAQIRVVIDTGREIKTVTIGAR